MDEGAEFLTLARETFENIQLFFTHHMLMSVGLLLLSGYFLARLASRVKLPEVTGFIIAGLVMGESILGFVPHHVSSDMSLVTEVALGLIALTIGGEFYWVKLKSMGPGVVIITLIQIFAAFISTTLGLYLFNMELPYAMILGAIATATAPAATVAIVQSLNASGKFVDYLYGVVALDDAGAVIVFGVVFALVGGIIDPQAAQGVVQSASEAAHGGGHGTGRVILHALMEVVMSVGTGALAGYILHLLVRKKRKPNEIMIISLGVVFFTIGLAVAFNLSPLLTNMAAGAVIINLGARNHRIFHILEPLTPPIYALFFVLAGSELDLSILGDPRVVLLGSVYILFRALGKYGGVWVGAKIARSPRGISEYLGLCMLPQAGVAIGLTLMVQASPLGQQLMAHNPAILSDMINIVLISVFINELFGPPLSKFALVRGLELEE
ncbi:cation:proton antiporter [Salinispira pacifica]|uniref:Putative Na(+)/H(+) antiporter n=1 Tax=Salinispira pacifica TaxID=1307761 RepID=V5WD80_9SPIO|nr:cation:proton antiporter [Salinispira pacifica]AHC13545.1 Putative Na(+)/H(+) antiporter [Salinispira pacifica]